MSYKANRTPDEPNVTIVILGGHSLLVTLGLLRALIMSKHFWFIFLLATVAGFLLSDFQIATGGPRLVGTLVWFVSAVFAILAFFGTILILMLYFPNKRVHEFPIAFASISFSTVIADEIFLLAKVVTENSFSDLVIANLSALIGLHLGTQLIVRFWVPRFWNQIEDPKVETDVSPLISENTPIHYSIGTRTYDAATTLYIQSQNQYLSVFSERSQTLVSGSISKVEAQIPAHLGRKVHRSYFVFSHAILGFDVEMQELELKNNQKIPVSRRQQRETQEWVESVLQSKP